MSERIQAVIGTAGRGTDAPRITQPLYDAMYGHALSAAEGWDAWTWVSGGAAVADHLAVRGWLEGRVRRLILFLPARFENGRFVENPRNRYDPGKRANELHEAFSKACGIDSLGELAFAVASAADGGKGVETHFYYGFKRRNLEVAAVPTHMIALTFGSMRAPEDFAPEHPGFTNHGTAGLKDGGTAHTWGEAWRCETKRHVSLTWLERELAADSAPLSGRAL